MKHQILLFAFFFVLGDCLDCGNVNTNVTELRLRKKLICNYDKSVRPQNQVNVGFEFILKRFTFKNYGYSRNLELQSWNILRWTDERLKWNPSEYEGISKNYASFNDLWIPDVSLIESDVMEDMNSCTEVDCNIYSNGDVECALPCEHNAYCGDANNWNWPFDSATCNFTYMSRRYSTKYLNLIGLNMTVDADGGKYSRSWELISSYGYTGNKSFNEFILTPQEPKAEFSFLVLIFKIVRYNKELIYQIIIPAVVIILFNIFVLLLDANLNEKWILYAINVFNHRIYNVQLNYMIPENADLTPKVFVFFCISQIITTILMLKCLLMKIYVTTQSQQGGWMKLFYSLLQNRWLGEPFTNMKENFDGDYESRLFFSRIIDRLLMIILACVYCFMFLDLMPEKSNSDNESGVLFLENDY